MWQFWLIAAGIFFIGEIITTGFLIFWLGIGSLLAMIVSFLTDNIIIQTAVFVVSSCLLIFLTKPFVDKFITKNEKKVKTNAYSIIGKVGIVTEEINPMLGTGLVKVGTETWSAISEDKSVIKKDAQIEIKEIIGVKVVVQEKVLAPQN